MFGNPKIGDGLCWWGKHRPAVEERIDGKRKAKAWLEAVYAGVELEDIEF
jgi:hypothetical protein